MKNTCVLYLAVGVLASTIFGCTPQITQEQIPARLQEAQVIVRDSINQTDPTDQAFEKAKGIYQAVLKVDPNNPYALNNLAWLTIRTEGSQRKPTLEKALAMFQLASTNAAGKTASSFVTIVVFFPRDGCSIVKDVDVCSFSFLLRGIREGNKPEETTDILPIIKGNIFRTQYHLKSALEK